MTETTSPGSHPSRRLTYADPRDLPSFPSSGLPADGAAAGAAATLGWNSRKSADSPKADVPKSDQLQSASAAAALAKENTMNSSSTPSADSPGYKAALLAVGSASSALRHQTSNSSTPEQHDGWGHSAATQAFHASRPASASSISLSYGNTAAAQAFNANRTLSSRTLRASPSVANSDRSLAAAKGAMASTRPRSTSSPTAGPPVKPRNGHSRANSSALDGATTAHRASIKSRAPTEDAGAVPVTTMTRNMFTSHPQIKLEVDEQKNTDKLHSSAVAMAKKMYTLQQAQGTGDGETRSRPSSYLNLQDAAYKQAQERLSKLESSYTNNRDLQEYYGHPKAPKRHFSVSHRLRRKNSEEALNDRRESERIRQQMSMFSNKLTEVDKTKRQNDREALLAAAQKNVKARLHDMDEKVFYETGMVNPTLSKDWDARAHDAAKNRIVASNNDSDKDKRDLGGGMFMDQEQIDAIAAKRMQPVLDDLNEKAEKERERLEILKAEEDARKQEHERQKEREREAREFNKKTREEEKLKRHQQKEEERAKREQEKAEKAEKRRLEREEKAKSKHDSGFIAGEVPGVHGQHERESTSEDPSPVSGTFEHSTGQRVTAFDTSEPVASSPRSKVKGWLRNRFSRGRAPGNDMLDSAGTDNRFAETDDRSEKSKNSSSKRRSFLWPTRAGAMGGIARSHQSNTSAISLDNASGIGSSSMRDVATAGRFGDVDAGEARPGSSADAGAAAGSIGNSVGTSNRVRRDSQGVSMCSSAATNDAEEAGPSRERERFYDTIDMLPPRPIGGGPGSRMSVSPSPSRDSRFHEDFD